MIIKDLNITSIPTALPESTIDLIATLFDDNQVVAILGQDEKLLGIIHQSKVDDVITSGTTSGILELMSIIPSVRDDSHLFHAARQIRSVENQWIAIVDKDERYLGVIENQAIFDRVLDGLNLDMETGVIAVELKEINLSLSQVIQIIEQESLKIMGVTVHRTDSADHDFIVTIKLNSQETFRAVASLERFGYKVYDFAHDYVHNEELEERAAELMHFLNI